jgi:hypothetical protein
MDDDEQISGVLRQLAQYLKRNPEACDSVEGIAQWWLKEPRPQKEELERALAVMESLNLVKSIYQRDGSVLFRRAGLGLIVDAKLDELISGDDGSLT